LPIYVSSLTTTHMQCLIYARVSTDKQAEKELSIPAQLQAMRQFAQQRSWSVAEEFVEAGVSGRTAERPVLHRLLARCRESNPKVDAVIVHKLDRLARNLADHVAIRATLNTAGVQLVSVSENLDDSVSGHLVENIMAALAEFYSANLSQEVLKGMTECVRQGGWPRGLPRGYLRNALTRQAEPDPAAAPLIRFAFETVATGRYQLKVVCAWLARRQLDLPHALTHPFCYPKGSVASRSLLPLWQTQGGHDGTEGQHRNPSGFAASGSGAVSRKPEGRETPHPR
jgi:site-specific DNA recombinase